MKHSVRCRHLWIVALALGTTPLHTQSTSWTAAAERDWVLIASTNDLGYFVDPASRSVVEPSRIRMWAAVRPVAALGQVRGPDREHILMEFNCATRQSTFIEVLVNDGSAMVPVQRDSPRWNVSIPNIIRHMIMVTACGAG